MNTSSDSLRNLISAIKRRWIARALKQGGAVLLLTILLCSAFYLLLLYRYELSPLWQTVIIAAALVILLAETVQLIVRPLFKRFSDQKIAMFVEEKFPELEDRLNSAVELETPVSRHERDAIIDMLIEDASRKAGMVQISTVVDHRKEQILTWAACSLFVLAALFVMSFRSEIGTVTSRMTFLFDRNAEFRPEISISPGDIQIEKGDSQEILVTLRKESAGDVVLHYRTGGDVWRREPMAQGITGAEYMYRFASIQEPVTYYVEYRESLSPEYTISIYEFPKVARIDLEYSFPEYTGMPDRTEENTGNIRGLKGSGVTLTITTSGTAETGELVLDDSRTIPLAKQGGGVFSGNLVIEDYATYYVRLTDARDMHNKFPEEYLITPVEDELPLITITDPKRDVRVNPVEEVLIAAQAEDDFGVNGLELRYSINGADEDSIPLAGEESRGLPDVSGSHVMYLEDFALEPGDIIAYYLQAGDNYHTEPSMTDMYFIEVTPFDASYTQSNNQQGGQPQGAQQQGGSQMVMNQQMIIAATWKLHRQRNEQTAEEYSESLDALAQAQANLMYNISDRVNSTVMSQEMVTDDDFLAIADLLRAAVDEMSAALESIQDSALMEALKPEQRALNYLLKADAMNKEKQVQRRQANQSGGSSGQSSEERMTELMDLELDISQDKYEIQQQARNQQAQEMDDAMERLRRLAERQQELARQSRDNIRQDEEESRRFLDRLQRDQEELRRQAEELSERLREMSRNDDQMSRQMRDRMERVAETMRQAEEDLKNNNIQESMSRQQQALNDLNRLQQDLRFSMTDNAREMLREFTENFNRLQEREEELARDLNETYTETMGNNGRMPDVSELRELTDGRRSIRENLQTLEDQARTVEEQTLQENPDIATDMRNIRNSIRRENLERNMQQSERFLESGWLTYALPLEADITSGLDSLAVQVGRLQETAPVTEEERLSRSLAETREMRQRLEDMIARAENDTRDPSQSTGGGRRRQQQADSGEPRDESDQQQNAGGRQPAEQQQAQSSQQQAGGEQPGQEQSQDGQESRESASQQAQMQEQQGRQSDREQQQGARNMAGGGSGDRDAALEMEQLMDQFDRLLDSMEQEFADDPEMRQALENTRFAPNSNFTGELLGGDAEEHFRREVFEPLSQLEMYLMQRLDEIDIEKKLYSSRSADVPAEYQGMVDRYFESIAKQNNSE